MFGLSFSPDGSRLAVVWTDAQIVRVFDLATGRAILEFPSGGAHFANFSPDGERLALVGDDQPRPQWWTPDRATRSSPFRVTG